MSYYRPSQSGMMKGVGLLQMQSSGIYTSYMMCTFLIYSTLISCQNVMNAHEKRVAAEYIKVTYDTYIIGYLLLTIAHSELRITRLLQSSSC